MLMARTLARHVHVRHPENGDVHVFTPGEQPPGWAQLAITNPKAWGDDDSPPVDEYYAAQTASAPPDTEEQAPPDTESGDGTPPKVGRRAGRPPGSAKA